MARPAAAETARVPFASTPICCTVHMFSNITTAIVANVKKHSPAHRMTPRCSRVTPITTHSAKAITSPSLSRDAAPNILTGGIRRESEWPHGEAAQGGHPRQEGGEGTAQETHAAEASA